MTGDHGCTACRLCKGKGKVAYENYFFHENLLCQNQFDLNLILFCKSGKAVSVSRAAQCTSKVRS